MWKAIIAFKEAFFVKYQVVEKNIFIIIVAAFLTTSVGGLVEIVPLFTINSTIEDVEGVRPYTPLELTGRNIYVREGCYACHSQQIRPFRDEVERYGHYSIAAESKYDKPFQWGSKRTGPDLARVGGKYSSEWHYTHLMNPRSVIPQSIMPSYLWLAKKEIDGKNMSNHLRALRTAGVPYTQEQIDNATEDLLVQVDPDGETDGLEERYGETVRIENYDGNIKITEMDALIAYLQVIGTMVDFKNLKAKDLRQ